MRPAQAAAGSDGYETGAWTAQRSWPRLEMSSIQEPLISLTSDAASGKWRRAVDCAEGARRVVRAHAGLAVLTHDPCARRDEEDAAVVRVSDGDEAVRKQVRVIWRVEVPGRASPDVHVTVAPQHPSRRGTR